ncbi:MAG: decarboxylating 6-phosphogluconate dehydrogenase [Armatimonadota bacterium]|nr:decarboxylating 6-phosphogluconate dehydrogenase [Armatimonadota bacterium]MDR5698037.1 decarboxylating 6-phosphogluconate dehydrogenase [Armatimonadota bacterium]
MQVGMIGLGRMGAGMGQRLIRAGHEVVGHARSTRTVRQFVESGGRGAESLQALVDALARPRALWMMIPAGEGVDRTLEQLAPLLGSGDVVVDGGNSHYRDSMRRAAWMRARGLHFVDVGTSGGVWGLSEGYCLMIGGDPEPVGRLRPLFEALAPAPDRGWGHVGPNGAGHFVKMVHNGIEYGLMQAYAEGFAILRRANTFGLDVRQVAQIWRWGSVVRSWLLDLAARGLAEDPDLHDVAPYVEDSGEGRWAVAEAIALDTPAPVITLALLQRLRSRDAESYADRVLAMLRHQFGGHAFRRPD